MSQLQKDLQAVSKSLRQLTRKTEQMVKKVDRLEKLKSAKAKAKPVKRRVAKRPAKRTAIDTVLGIIKRGKKGVDIPTLKKKTGFDNKKIYNVIDRLKRQGKIKRAGLGIYTS